LVLGEQPDIVADMSALKRINLKSPDKSGSTLRFDLKSWRKMDSIVIKKG